MGGTGRRVYRNNYKGHMDKNKVGWNQGRDGGKGRKLYLNNNKIQKYFITKKKRKLVYSLLIANTTLR